MHLSLALLRCLSPVLGLYVCIPEDIFNTKQKKENLTGIKALRNSTSRYSGRQQDLVPRKLLQSSHSSAWDPVGCLNGPENETVPAVNDCLPRLPLRASFPNGILKIPTIELGRERDTPQEIAAFFFVSIVTQSSARH